MWTAVSIAPAVQGASGVHRLDMTPPARRSRRDSAAAHGDGALIRSCLLNRSESRNTIGVFCRLSFAPRTVP